MRFVPHHILLAGRGASANGWHRRAVSPEKFRPPGRRPGIHGLAAASEWTSDVIRAG